MKRTAIQISILLVATFGSDVAAAEPLGGVQLPPPVNLPSKNEESNSIRTAHNELERLTGLTKQQQYDHYRCQLWFYESLRDASNSAKLNEGDWKDLKKVVGDQGFFLHRFTPKGDDTTIYEIIVSKDGSTVKGKRTKPTEKQK